MGYERGCQHLGTSVIDRIGRGVEQICEDIVLINNGKNVLEGNVKHIKQAYKDNKYRIEYSGDLADHFTNRYEISAHAEQAVKCLINSLTVDGGRAAGGEGKG